MTSEKPTPSEIDPPHRLRERLDYILAAQEHCDHYLSRIADPTGKSVLVAGCGAGTEMLWCLRHGATEVVGIDVAPQSPVALRRAVDHLGLAGARFEIHQMSIEQAPQLGRSFDLVLSNNVFEHVPQLSQAFAACAALVLPFHGRVAIFTDPLYYSSSGSHLPTQPWEHLWGEPSSLRDRVVCELPADHALHEHDLGSYLHREISLNRMRLADFLAALSESGLVVLNLHVERDRRLQELAAHLDALQAAELNPKPSTTDFAIEGIAVELMRIDPDTAPTLAFDATPTEESRLYQRIRSIEDEHGRQRRLAEEALDSMAAQKQHWQDEAGKTKAVLDAVTESVSFRLGRALTAPLRKLRTFRKGA